MKIKDKVSGEVYEAETWKSWDGGVQYVKKGTNGPLRSSDDVEIIEEEKPKDTTDWDAFRREAAKDILAGFAAKIGHPMSDYSEQSCKYAIQLADELIKQLKDK